MMSSVIPTWQVLLVLIGSYLVGSIPSAYLLVRLVKGVDIRKYGSGSVGGSNAGTTLGHWAMVVIGIFDIIKGATVVWLVFVALDLGIAIALLAGLCATIGHDWSIYLGFNGGKGISTILGTLLVIFPWGGLLILVSPIISWLLKSTAGSSIGLLLLPWLSLLLETDLVITWGSVAMILITALKRLEANGQPLPEGPARWEVIGRRLWLDRDMADHKAWLARVPEQE